MRAYKAKLQIAEYVDDIPDDKDLEDIDRILSEIEFTVQINKDEFSLDVLDENDLPIPFSGDVELDEQDQLAIDLFGTQVYEDALDGKTFDSNELGRRVLAWKKRGTKIWHKVTVFRGELDPLTVSVERVKVRDGALYLSSDGGFLLDFRPGEYSHFVDHLYEDHDTPIVARKIKKGEARVSTKQTEAQKPDDSGTTMRVTSNRAYYLENVSSWNTIDGELYVYGMNKNAIATFAAGQWTSIVPADKADLEHIARMK